MRDGKMTRDEMRGGVVRKRKMTLGGEKEEDSFFFRTAGLLRIDPLFWDVPIDPTVTQLVEGVLGACCSTKRFKPACNTW